MRSRLMVFLALMSTALELVGCNSTVLYEGDYTPAEYGYTVKRYTYYGFRRSVFQIVRNGDVIHSMEWKDHFNSDPIRACFTQDTVFLDCSGGQFKFDSPDGDVCFFHIPTDVEKSNNRYYEQVPMFEHHIQRTRGYIHFINQIQSSGYYLNFHPLGDPDYEQRVFNDSLNSRNIHIEYFLKQGQIQ